MFKQGIELVVKKGVTIHQTPLEKVFLDWDEEPPTRMLQILSITHMAHAYDYRQEVQEALAQAKADGLIIAWIATFEGNVFIG